MTNKELTEFNKNRKLFQICVVSKDVEKTIKEFVDKLNMGPWKILTFTEETVKGLKINGKLVKEPFKFLIALTQIGDMEIEVIQPVYGPMIYEEYLNRKGEGLHHIKERIADDDMERVLADYASKGIEVTQTGTFEEDVHYYLNTESDTSIIYELGNCPYIELPPEMVRIYPEE